jgi:hypothetical protein
MYLPRAIGRKVHRITRKLHSQGALNSDPVTLRWTELVIPPGHNPHIETSPQPTATEHTAQVTAFVHYVNIHTTGYSKFTQIRQGDVILDFPGDVELDNKPQLRFEIGGKIYIQKDGGDELAASWDVRCNGQPVTRTVLVTLLA